MICYLNYIYKTDEEWQKIFNKLKDRTQFSGQVYMPIVYENTLKDGYTNTIITESNYRYRQFINSILKTIRRGQQDYCFFLYQIEDLLKYEPNIQCVFVPNGEYFIVSLNTEIEVE